MVKSILFVALFGLLLSIVAVRADSDDSTPRLTILDDIQCQSPGTNTESYCVNVMANAYTLGSISGLNNGFGLCDTGYRLGDWSQAGTHVCQFFKGQQAKFYCYDQNTFIRVTFGDSYAYVDVQNGPISYSWQTNPSTPSTTYIQGDILTVTCQ